MQHRLLAGTGGAASGSSASPSAPGAKLALVPARETPVILLLPDSPEPEPLPSLLLLPSWVISSAVLSWETLEEVPC